MVALLVAAIRLPLEDTSRFTFFWAVLFCVFGVLNGLALETTRAVTSARSQACASGWPVGRVLAAAMVFVGVVCAATAPAWRLALPAMDGSLSWLTSLAVVVGVTGFAGHTTFASALAGNALWRLYSLTVVAESAVRLVLILAAAWLGGGLIGLAFATVAAEYAWIGVAALSRDARHALSAHTDAGPRLFWRRVGSATAGQAASAILVVGFPWLLGLTSTRAVALTAAPLTMSVTLTRAPLMVPLNAFQNVAVAHFSQARGGRLGAAGRIFGLVCAVGIAGAGLAWLIGPWLLRLIGPGYVIDQATMAGLTLGATSLAILTLTGVLCQASALYRVYVTGWVTAAAVAVGALLLPLALAPRAVAALLAGPLIGSGVHFLGLRRARAETRPASALRSEPN
ncbi:MAG: hypothetical protein LBR32_00620 [Propionibacteriaceae bacterium]|jgi:hypothetical protein|nr:hypothetical protein [Propionibacteriaceae bacterium]